MEQINDCRWEKPLRKCHVCFAALRYILYAQFSQICESLRDFHRLFWSRNSPTTGIVHTIRHVYRRLWPAREAKPRWSRLIRTLYWKLHGVTRSSNTDQSSRYCVMNIFAFLCTLTPYRTKLKRVRAIIFWSEHGQDNWLRNKTIERACAASCLSIFSASLRFSD